MNKNLTELVMILDMSGSMQPLQYDTIGGYNTLIEEQKKEEGEAFVTTVLFDDRYIVLHDRTNIKDVELLTDRQYVPRGMTAMLDAVGRTIVSVGQTLAEMPEDERPGKVMVTIITDGYENASREYSWASVQKMIKEQREKYNWIFTFIGADIDNIKVSDNLGIDRSMSKKYTKNAAGSKSVYASVSNSMKKVRNAQVVTTDLYCEVAKELDEIE